MILTKECRLILACEVPSGRDVPCKWTWLQGNEQNGFAVDQHGIAKGQKILESMNVGGICGVDATSRPSRERNSGSENRGSERALNFYVLTDEDEKALQNSGNRGNGPRVLRFVSAKRFWCWVQKYPSDMSQELLNVVNDMEMYAAMIRLWGDAMSATRQRVASRLRGVIDAEKVDYYDDSVILNVILPRPLLAALEFDVNAVFAHGTEACPGAYRVAEMSHVAENLPIWRAKLLEPYRRYIEEELRVVREGFGPDSKRQPSIKDEAEKAAVFVWDILNYPLQDGSILRDELGNLEELAAVRNALKLFLRGRYPEEMVENPLGMVNRTSNSIVAAVLRQRLGKISALDDRATESLLRLSVLMNALDFHTPDFREAWSSSDALQRLVERQFDALADAVLESELGGRYFIREFIDRWLRLGDREPAHLVFFCDNNGQVVVSLKCVETFLLRRPGLRVTLVPKNGRYGNDASCEDIDEVLSADAASEQALFSQLRSMFKTGRFAICRDGPKLQGLDPRRLSQELCRRLQRADVILAEGQAYAEIRGWMKPTYLLFQVKGRVAEAIHGIERQRKALAFVRVGNGIEHFSHLDRLPERLIRTEGCPEGFHAYGQTTKDYVDAVLSPNYAILRDKLFYGRESMLVAQLREESARTGRTLAEIVLGTRVPSSEDVDRVRHTNSPGVFVIGGGGGMNAVTLKALEALGDSVAAGVPSTDDGGSTGKLQQMIAPVYGYFFGVGDAAAILEQEVEAPAKKPILSFRPKEHMTSLVVALIEHIRNESREPTIEGQNIADCPDYLAFVCEQLNLARVIDEHFLGPNKVEGFTIKGASIRNLNILAGFHLCGAISPELGHRNPARATDAGNAERAWYLIEKALGQRTEVRGHVRPLPVSYDQGVIWAKYSEPIPLAEITRLQIPTAALAQHNRVVFGQRFIDQISPSGKIVDFGLVRSSEATKAPLPEANPVYLEALRGARLVVMGAGSLFSSQLAQLAIPGVVEELLKKKDTRRVLVVNHVCMNETSHYSLSDHIRAIERLAEKARHRESAEAAQIRIGDLFTDIVVPRTVAREIHRAIERGQRIPANEPSKGDSTAGTPSENSEWVNPDGTRANPGEGILRNRYVNYVLKHPAFREEHQIADWELRVLGFLEQPASAYKGDRAEAGRYRGPVFATKRDFNYLERQGIARRNIYEVESIGMSTKILKAEGKPKIEQFPGLTAESLIGIFKILMQKGMKGVGERKENG